MLILRAPVGGIVAERLAQLQVGGKYFPEPVLKRHPKRIHHDGHRHHQAEADDDRGEAQGGQGDVIAQLREGRVGHHPVGARRNAQQPHGEPRHQEHRPQQERGDRGVAEEGQPAEGRKPREDCADQEQGEPCDPAFPDDGRGRLIATLEGPRRRLSGRGACREPGARGRDRRADRGEDQQTRRSGPEGGARDVQLRVAEVAVQ